MMCLRLLVQCLVPNKQAVSKKHCCCYLYSASCYEHFFMVFSLKQLPKRCLLNECLDIYSYPGPSMPFTTINVPIGCTSKHVRVYFLYGQGNLLKDKDAIRHLVGYL